MLLGTTLEVVFDPSTCLMNHSPFLADRQNEHGTGRSSSSLSKFSDIVKLREREGQRVDLGMSLKGHLWMVDGGWWYTFP